MRSTASLAFNSRYLELEPITPVPYTSSVGRRHTVVQNFHTLPQRWAVTTATSKRMKADVAGYV